MKTAFAVVAILGFVAVGCGGNTFGGTVAGSTLDPKGAIFDLVTENDGQGDTAQALVVFMSDQTDLCSVITGGHSFKSTTVLSMTFFTLNADRNAFTTVATGKYEVVQDPTTATGQNIASISYAQSDSSCNSLTSQTAGTATGGTAEVDSFKSQSGGTSSGSFNLDFTGTDTAKGSFNATWCDMQAAFDSTTATTCD